MKMLQIKIKKNQKKIKNKLLLKINQPKINQAKINLKNYKNLIGIIAQSQ
jgi:hypothetical protein